MNPTQELALANEFYQDEKPTTYEQRLPCALVLDSSWSIEGEPIKQLNKGIKIYQTAIQNDVTASNSVETAVIKFDSEVEVVQDFSLAEGQAIPDITTGGATHLVEGVEEALRRIEARKQWYKDQGLTYYRPFIILITDGAPNGPGSIDALKEKIYKGVEEKKFRFWAFGVEGADMDLLKGLSHPEFPPMKLKGYNFQNFFEWLSASMSIYSNSAADDKIDVSPANTVGEENSPFQITAE